MINSVCKVLVVLIPIQLSGQSDTVRQSIHFDNGKISSEGFMVEGKPVGYWKSYFENGNLKSEGGRTGFELEGVWKFYNERGGISRIITYGNGRKNGFTYIYNDSSVLIREEHYENDVLHGKTREYYSSGDSLVKWVIPYDKGIMDGTAFEYEKDGR